MTAEQIEQLQFPQLVDIKTLADLLGTSVRHLRGLVEEEAIPYLKLGRLLRFDLAEIRAWLQEHRHPAKRAPARAVMKERSTS